MNAEGTANCLTSVGKDNWVLEPVVLTKERTDFGKQSRKRYGRKEVSLRWSEINKHTPRKDGCSGTITTVQKDNYLVEPNGNLQIQYLGSIGNIDRIGDGKNLSRNSRTGDRVYSTDGVATTISAEGGGVGGHTGLYLEPTKDVVVSKLNKSAKHQQDLVQSDSGVCQTLVVGSHLNSDTYTKTVVDTPQHKYPFRIRKLTPKECWRLQGFDDEDIDNCVASGVSSSQLYKQAGNSIAVNCLEAIFGNLLGIEREFEVDDDSEMRLF